MADEPGKPTLHHLNNSQSQRILWLLEELNIPYNLKLYERNKSGKDVSRSPPELFEPHKLGKSPVLVTSDGRTITESSAIATYLLKTYDTAGKFQSDDWIRDEMLTSIANTNMGAMLTIKLLLDISAKMTPWLVKPLVGMMMGGIDSAFAAPETQKNLEYLEEEFGDKDYFMGDEPGRADFTMSWPFDIMVQRNWIDLEPFPKLKAWRARCLNRPAWKSAMEKGNGYDLAAF